MRTVLVASSKGGAGKSTLATNLAAYFALDGQRTVLVDADRQKSSTHWCEKRAAMANAVLPLDGTRRNWEAKLPSDAQRVVIDAAAGAMGEDLESFLAKADAVLVPVNPSIIDLEATVPFLNSLAQHPRVKKGKLPVGLVGNRLKPWTSASQQAVGQLKAWPKPRPRAVGSRPMAISPTASCARPRAAPCRPSSRCCWRSATWNSAPNRASTRPRPARCWKWRTSIAKSARSCWSATTRGWNRPSRCWRTGSPAISAACPRAASPCSTCPRTRRSSRASRRCPRSGGHERMLGRAAPVALLSLLLGAALRGLGRPVSFLLLPSDCARPGLDCDLQVHGRVSRKAFGMSAYRVLVRDQVDVRFRMRLREAAP